MVFTVLCLMMINVLFFLAPLISCISPVEQLPVHPFLTCVWNVTLIFFFSLYSPTFQCSIFVFGLRLITVRRRVYSATFVCGKKSARYSLLCSLKMIMMVFFFGIAPLISNLSPKRFLQSITFLKSVVFECNPYLIVLHHLLPSPVCLRNFCTSPNNALLGRRFFRPYSLFDTAPMQKLNHATCFFFKLGCFSKVLQTKKMWEFRRKSLFLVITPT